MHAEFWIETVQFTIEVPVFEPGQPPLVIPAETGAARTARSRFPGEPAGRDHSAAHHHGHGDRRSSTHSGWY